MQNRTDSGTPHFSTRTPQTIMDVFSSLHPNTSHETHKI